MYLLIVLLPLLGSPVAGASGRFLGSEGTAIVTTTCVSLSPILSLVLAISKLLHGSPPKCLMLLGASLATVESPERVDGCAPLQLLR